MNAKKIQVIDVVEPPAIGKNIAMMGGIRTKEAAEKWAAGNGYPTVYFWKQRERVYADRLAHVAAVAQQIEKQSDMLVSVSERGQGLLEFLLVLLVVILALVILLHNVPW